MRGLYRLSLVTCLHDKLIGLALTDGSLSGGINREGVNYYNNLINELLSKGTRV